MISDYTINSLFDEMEKIAASLLLNAGNPIKFSTKAARYVKGMAQNAGGALKTMATDPVGGFKRGLQATAAGMGTKTLGGAAGTLLTVSNPISQAYGAVKKEDPEGRNRSRIARGIQAAGSLAGEVIGTPFHGSGAVAGSLAGEAAGKMVGRGIDRLRGRKWTAPNKMPVQPNQMVEPPPRTQL